VRIIAGTLKGRSLKAPVHSLAVRPTADRAREALFSILQKWPQGPFLDLYAGTGAVGLEAHSRGYLPVTCVEYDPEAVECLKKNARNTDVTILDRDARRLDNGSFKGLAVIFADPPYEATVEAFTLQAPRMRKWLAPGGILVVEASAGTALPPAEGFELLEVRRYGAAEFTILRRA